MAKNKFWFQAHWVVGVTVGVLLALMGMTGATMAFQDYIVEALNADVRTVAVNGARLPMPALLERADAEAVRNGARLHSLELPKEADAAARANFESEAGDSVRFLDPYTGEWRDGGTRGEAFFGIIEEIHRGLITDRVGGHYVGRRIVDAAAVVLLGIVATGLYLRWPRRLSNWRAWFVIDRRLRGRGFLWSLHSVAGTYVFPLLLLSVLTGLYFAYDWYWEMWQRLPGAPVAAEEVREQPFVSPDIATAWSVFERETSTLPVGDIVVRLPLEGGEALQVQYLDVDAPHDKAINVMKIDPATSQLLQHARYADKPAGGKLLASMLTLHKGNFFGVGGRLVMMLSSLAMSLFVVTGWMMYLDRRRVEERARKRQAASQAAA